jgi:hypothetical protein
MSGEQETHVGAPKGKRKRKAPHAFAEIEFEGIYDPGKKKGNTEGGKKILEASQGKKVFRFHTR